MGSVNKVILVGNLGRDAEVRYTPGGAAVAKFSLATTEVWNDKGGQRQERTEWHNIDLWGKQAENLSEYLQKGKQVFVEGRIQSRKVSRCRECDAYFPERDAPQAAGQDRGSDDGRKKEILRCPKCSREAVPYIQTFIDVRADRVTLLGSSGAGRPAGGYSRGADDHVGGHLPAAAPSEVSEPLTDDDIPF